MEWTKKKYTAELKGIHIIFHTLSPNYLPVEGYLVKGDHLAIFEKEWKEDGGNPRSRRDPWLRVRMMHFYSIGHTYTTLFNSASSHLSLNPRARGASKT